MTPAEIIPKLTEAQKLASIMRGDFHRGTYSPDRIRALWWFPMDGTTIRATVYMRYKQYSRLKVDGLIEGPTTAARITLLGQQVRNLLEKDHDTNG